MQKIVPFRWFDGQAEEALDGTPCGGTPALHH